MSFSNILNYFKSEKEIFSQNSISLKSCLNYENIQHILITLENKINNFPENNKVNISQKNKFDFMIRKIFSSIKRRRIHFIEV